MKLDCSLEKIGDSHRFTMATDDILNASFGNFKIDVNQINTERFNKNPIVLFNHNQEMPVGRVQNLSILDNTIYGDVVFSDATEKSREVKALIEDGTLKGGSISIQPQIIKNGKVKTIGGELLEFSIVSIPRNKNTLINNMEELMLATTDDSKGTVDKIQDDLTGLLNTQNELKNTLNDKVKEIENSLTAKTNEIDALKNSIGQNKPTITINNNHKFSTIGDALILKAEAEYRNMKVQEVLQDKIDNSSDFQKERFLQAGAWLNNFAEDMGTIKNSYNLDDIAAGASIGNSDNFLIAEALKQEGGLLSLNVNEVQLANGVGYFTNTKTLGEAGAFVRDGSDIKNAESEYKQVNLFAKEYAGLIYIENNMIRNSQNPQLGAFLQNQLIASLTTKINNAVINGSGAEGNVTGLKYLDVSTINATGSPDTTKIRKDLLKISKTIAKLPYNRGLVWYGAPSTKYDLLGWSTTTGDSANFARSLEATGTMFGKEYVEDIYLDGDTIDLYLMSPENIVVGYSNKLVVNSGQIVNKDRTVINAITGFDFKPIYTNAIGKIAGVQTWEG